MPASPAHAPEPPPHAVPLPMAQPSPAERADAARNRARLLAAATRLVTEHGAEHVTMEAVAAEASVGKGTVFRRFGTRAGLMRALLGQAEQDYQREFLFGSPPLGPGAPAPARLRAFGVATVRYEIRNRELSVAAVCGAGADRYLVPARLARLTHVLTLLRAAGVTGELELLAEALLGYLDTGLINHLHTRRGIPAARLEAGWSDLVDRLTTAPTGTAPLVTSSHY